MTTRGGPLQVVIDTELRAGSLGSKTLASEQHEFIYHIWQKIAPRFPQVPADAPFLPRIIAYVAGLQWAYPEFWTGFCSWAEQQGLPVSALRNDATTMHRRSESSDPTRACKKPYVGKPAQTVSASKPPEGAPPTNDAVSPPLHLLLLQTHCSLKAFRLSSTHPLQYLASPSDYTLYPAAWRLSRRSPSPWRHSRSRRLGHGRVWIPGYCSPPHLNLPNALQMIHFIDQPYSFSGAKEATATWHGFC